MDKVFEERPKVMECPNCHSRTLKLIRKFWQQNLKKGYTELRGYYECEGCGNSGHIVFARERICQFDYKKRDKK